MTESVSGNTESSEAVIADTKPHLQQGKLALFGKIALKIIIVVAGLIIGCILGVILAFTFGFIDFIC